MSSHRRSNHPPPSWRASHKLRAATGVSFIYAQPLQGSPLRSAIDNLPAIGIDDSASFISEMSRKRESRDDDVDTVDGVQKESDDRRSVMSSAGTVRSGRAIPDVVLGDASEGQSSQNMELTAAEGLEAPNANPAAAVVLTESPKTVSQLSLPDTSTPTVSLPASTSPPKLSEEARSRGRRSSWFSFSMSKETVSMSVSVPEPSTIETQQIPPENVRPSSASLNDVSTADSGSLVVPTVSSSRTQSNAPPLQATPVSPQVIPASPSSVSSPAIPTSITMSTISSVDDEVPPPKAWKASDLRPECSPAAVVQSRDSSSPGRKASVSSLNPSSSRFALRLPLLGRPKVPLDQVVASAANTALTSATSSEVAVPIVDKAYVVSSAPEQESGAPVEPLLICASTEDLTEPAVLEVTDLPVSPTLQRETTAASSSWWSYVGLGGSTTTVPSSVEPVPAAAELPPNSPDRIQADQDASIAAPPQNESSTQVTATLRFNDEPPLEHIPESTPGVQIQITASPSDDKPRSLLSAETAQSHVSGWYSPWAWYYGTSTSDNIQTLQSDASGGEPSEESTKTESEIVKEEALAGTNAEHAMQPLATIEPSPEPDIASPSSLPNPIEDTISSNRSGWASFFMSRALITKSITDVSTQRDENGMEVMDIDEDDEGQEVTVPSSVTQSSSPRLIGPESAQGQSSSMQTTLKSPLAVKPRESRKLGPAVPMTNSEIIKNETAAARSTSPAPSTKKSGSSTPTLPKPQPPNLVLPTWADTFHSLPRSSVPRPPPPPKSALSKTLSAVSGVLFAKDNQILGSHKGKERQSDLEILQFGKELPKAYDILGHTLDPTLLTGNCKVVVIGVAGWSPGAVIRTIAGGLPSSSSKFVNMTCSALERFEKDHGVKFQKITKIPLEGDGTISRKVTKVYAHLFENKDWIEDLHAADVIFVATHSQGSIVSTHLLDRLIREGHILTPRNVDILTSTAAAIVPGGSISASTSRTQRICCLALCGIHLGPLRYLKTSSLLQPYIQYFENAAARELFDFQDTETASSKEYINALRTVMDHGAKMVYIASLNDQVVPIYSGLFTAASHPRILRALYIDGDAYHTSDFLSNLLVLLIRVMNTGLSDSGLLAHLSEATAGTLSGIGHSTPYEELATYSLAVNYLFLANDGADVRTDLVIEPFNAAHEQNDYEIPWSLRDLIADERVAHFFAHEFSQLRDAFDDWQPRTSILRDIKRKLQPIQRLSSIRSSYSRL